MSLVVFLMANVWKRDYQPLASYIKAMLVWNTRYEGNKILSTLDIDHTYEYDLKKINEAYLIFRSSVVFYLF
jgi:hypothetical protein